MEKVNFSRKFPKTYLQNYSEQYLWQICNFFFRRIFIKSWNHNNFYISKIFAVLKNPNQNSVSKKIAVK
jgi:hypothetical protein